MDIYSAINNNFDNPDLSESLGDGLYQICYNANGYDEYVEFFLFLSDDLNALIALWEDYCNYNLIDKSSVVSVSYTGRRTK